MADQPKASEEMTDAELIAALKAALSDREIYETHMMEVRARILQRVRNGRNGAPGRSSVPPAGQSAMHGRA
jgi:hypothetical protein